MQIVDKHRASNRRLGLVGARNPAKGKDMTEPHTMQVALAQIAPVWLDRGATLHKVIAQIGAAAQSGSKLVVFGEALVPGYPFWTERPDGARFDLPLQKEIFAHYLDQAVQIESGHHAPPGESGAPADGQLRRSSGVTSGPSTGKRTWKLVPRSPSLSKPTRPPRYCSTSKRML